MSGVSGNYAQRVLSTIFLVSFGIYLFLATVTYTPFDPGWMHVSSDTQQVSNASGIAGAWVADMLYGLVGWSAVLLPIFLFVEAIQVWWPRSYLTRAFRYAAQFFILMTSAALMYFFWKVPSDSLNNASGGVVGYEIARSLEGVLSSIGAMVFLMLFNVLLWTLAFKLQWLKTLGLIQQIPSYLQDLFYKNIPESAEDYDLTLEHQQKAGVKHAASTLLEHQEASQALPEDAWPNDQLSESQQIREIEKKIAKQPEALRHETQNIVPTPAASPVLQTGEVWRASSATTAPQQDDAPAHQQAALAAIQSVPLPSSASQDAIELLIAEADRHLEQNLETMPTTASDVPSAQPQNNVLDWSDDQVFDALLAAVPHESKSADHFHAVEAVQATAHTSLASVVAKTKPTQIEDLSDLKIDDLEQWFEQPQPSPEAVEKTSLSKEAFIEAWQETAGKPEDDIDWDDLDAPLTDTSGRPVSRAFQVLEKRKHLSPLPGLELLDRVDPNKKVNFTAEQLSRLSELLEIKLQDFNVKAKVIEAQPGPVVTRFELDLAPGVKASKVTNISRDLARSMSMASVRVVEVIPGKPYIGIEVPNSAREMVRLIELLETPTYRDPEGLISMAMGKDISGNPVLTDLAKAPHMLVAGTTGSGKSVAVNAMILSMLLKYTPDQLRLILIDPKQLELANYNDIPHLLTPVVTDMKDAVSALNWCVNEMERRYKLMSFLKIRKITDYNRKVEEALARGEDLIDPTWKPSDSATQDRAPRLQSLPMIVIVADEFADMIMQVGKKAEEMITRLAQKSRAAGIHLLLATQRPSVDVITGLIKANIPTRVALRVNSKIDSRTILDAGGAEDLLGHGDMLFLGPGKIEPERVHGAFIADDEVNRICDAWRERASPNYVDEILTPFDEEGGAAGFEAADGDPNRDALYEQCVAFVLETRKASTSSLQRKFSLGYNRAARIIDQMEENGVVSGMGANGKREILV
jgi:S-DNA-T family DNA segregation ATPase FtsK/SpoIIIE